MKRLGLLGGTFDPIHIGHLVLAIEACQQRDLDAVIVVPARDPWQKGTVVASAERRLDMVNCAITSHAQLLSSIVDLEREGPSYAIDTIDDLAKQYPDVEFEFIVGSDALSGVPTWHRADELVSRVVFVCAERPGTPLEIPPGTRVATIQVPRLDISSTDIRERVAQGRSIAFLVPDAVGEYVHNEGLYRSM